MNIVYIPIDERPCNIDYVERMARTSSKIELICPDRALLGRKKEAADVERLWCWLKESAKTADALIISIDMLVYGGLLPSRLHHLSEDTASRWTERLRSLRADYPKLPVYASNLIMRTPKYSSSDEEPDYYEHWGRELFLRAFLTDKQSREGLAEKEKAQLDDITARLPHLYIHDYEKRRSFNSQMNTHMLELVAEGVLTFLAIPQDDSAEYGYTAIDQKAVSEKREALRLHKKVHMYPGADEVGATLLARAYNDLKRQNPKIYPIWSSTLGPGLIPMYEDRPFAESMKAHIMAAGCSLADSADDADFILAYNTPGRIMQESWNQNQKDITYTSFRNMLMFSEQITEFVEEGKKVIVADSAYANGGDRELITLLDDARVLDRLLSYKGWNTNCNTLGTTICQGILAEAGQEKLIKENLIYHLLDDYFYQSEIRMEMTAAFSEESGLTYFDLKEEAERICLDRNERLRERFNALILSSFENMELVEIKTFAPWNRMFECGIELKTKIREESPC
ncbi:DUF4127 family protein [Bacillus sp. FJAT-42376]|uniref:DUF4127 family protein n=1 Tax=Bacillus sp. FJAT-42376 TaxID=2014076 RepID=UPI000F506657|nr:DUF4127 family protein [Bacillus sp. FJAT-42376]AZB41693.1 DUF4127 family protein [Bacillus sp. FJAT-42376]